MIDLIGKTEKRIAASNNEGEIKIHVERNGISGNGKRRRRADRVHASIMAVGQRELHKRHKIGKETLTEIGVLIVDALNIVFIITIYR